MGMRSDWTGVSFSLNGKKGALIVLLCGWLGLVSLCPALEGAPVMDGESPQVQALLEQGWAAESGRGLTRNQWLAVALYRQAGSLGSAEGYYRAAIVLASQKPFIFGDVPSACLLAFASQLGHTKAALLMERSNTYATRNELSCDGDGFSSQQGVLAQFELDDYISALPVAKRQVVKLIRTWAPRYKVDTRLALTVASVESNFNSKAISPKSAMGVMQLMPGTAERFGVKNPFNAEENIRGGLAYLRWLNNYYGGDVVRTIAAYNAGEGAVDLYRGVPPYAETVAYVSRVLHFARIGLDMLPATGAGKSNDIKRSN